MVVPTYKRPQMLAECLNSIRDQTFPDFEVLVCDNSLEQEARVVVDRMDDHRFRYVPRPANIGIFGNAVTGLRDARSDFVMEVDDDDRLYPGALEALVSPLREDHTLVVAFADVEVTDSNGRILLGRDRADFLPERSDLLPGKHESFVALAARGRVFMMAALIRKDAIAWDEIPDCVATAYDRYLMLRASQNGQPAFYVDQKVTAYRVHAGADGASHASSQLAGALAALEIIEPHVSGTASRVVRQEIVRSRVMLGRALLHEEGLRAAAPVLRGLIAPQDLAQLANVVLFGFVPEWIRGHRNAPLGRERRRRRVTGAAAEVRPEDADASSG